MKKIILCLLICTTFLMSEFNRDADGIVVDTNTLLEWQDNYSDNEGNVKSVTWLSAINYCETLTLGNYSDWRLPNKNELLSIVDYTTSNPAINILFENIGTACYWTSTPYHYDGQQLAVYVCFSLGTTGGGTSTARNVRCVRGN